MKGFKYFGNSWNLSIELLIVFPARIRLFKGQIQWNRYGVFIIKVGLSTFQKTVTCFIESPLKMMENAFYFTLKVLFILKIFLSWLYGHLEKKAWLER